MAKADGMYGMFFGILETSDKKTETVAKQKAHIIELMETGVNCLTKRNYKDAKDTFAKLKGYLKISEDAIKKNKFNFTEDIPFFTLLGYCYSFLMDEKNSKKEEEVVYKDIQLLVKQAPKRQIVKFLELLFIYKKELWGECLFRCEKLQNMKIDPVEESKYKCPNMINKHAIPELDSNYCNIQVENIQEAAMYGHMEKLIKVEKARVGRKPDFTGLEWTKLWSPELNERVMKRLRSFKKPMNDLDIHKVFHGNVLPLMYGSCCPTSKSLYFYFKQEYMFKCEECLRARVQYQTKQEVLQKMAEENISHHGAICNSDCDDHFEDDDFFSDQYDDDDDEDDSDLDCEVYIPKKKLKALRALTSTEGETTSPKKTEVKPNDQTHKVAVDTLIDKFNVSVSDKTKINESKESLPNKNEIKNKTDKIPAPDKNNTPIKKTVATKIRSKEKEIQTDKPKINHRYCQTEVPKFKNFGIQTDLIKIIKPEPAAKLKHIGLQVDPVKPKNESVKCSHCFQMDKILNDELKELKSLMKKHDSKNESEWDINGFLQILQRIENNQNDTLEKIRYEKEDQICKNNFLQKLLLDHVNEKYSVYREIYAGLEKKCKYFIESVAALHNYLTGTTVPTLKENNIYLKRWQKTLSEVQCQSKELKVFYKKSKTRMIHQNQFETDDWPQISEIPVEALAFIFDSLRENAKLKEEANYDFRKTAKPQNKVLKNVTIVSPTKEKQSNKCVSPASSIESNAMSVTDMLTVQPILNINNKSNNIQLRPLVPSVQPIFRQPVLDFNNTNNNIQLEQEMPTVQSVLNFNNNKSNNIQLRPIVPSVPPIFRELLRPSFTNSTYQLIPMPPPRTTAIRPVIIQSQHIQEISPAPSPTPSWSSSQSQSPTPQPLTPAPQLLPRPAAPAPQLVPQTTTPRPPASAPQLVPRTPTPQPPPPASQLLPRTPTRQPQPPAAESRSQKITPHTKPQILTSISSTQPQPTILPAEFYRDFPPPPLPVKFTPQKTQEEYRQSEKEGGSNWSKANKENVPVNRPATCQRNSFDPKFDQRKFENLNDPKPMESLNDKNVPVEDDLGPNEPSQEAESGSSLESYMENQRMNRVKLRNVDENGKEIAPKRGHSDKEIFAFLQKHCNDMPEEDLIKAILTVMRTLKDSFGNLPKQEILRQVKAALPTRAAWKSTNLPLPAWKSDAVDTNCSICFEELSEESNYTLPCKHGFHKDCIKEWLQTNSVCPICRVHSVFDEDFPPLM